MGEKRKGFTIVSGVKCLIIGVIGSILLVASYIALELAWRDLIVYNEGLKNAFIGQIALIIFLVPVMTGIIAAWSLSSLKLRFNGSALAGLISGTTGGLGFNVALSVLTLTLNISNSNLQEWNTVHGVVYPVLTTGILSLFGDITFLALFILLSMMLSAIGGGIFFVISYYSGKRKKRQPGKSGTMVIRYTTVVFLAVIIIPIAAAFTGAATGIIKSQSFAYPVDFQRIGDDTITFTNNGVDSITDIDAGSPLIIYISAGGMNVKDITSQQTAAEDQLNVTLTPASGLGLSKGSSLTVSGPGIAGLAYTDEATGKKMVRVMVIGKTLDGRKIVIREKSV